MMSSAVHSDNRATLRRYARFVLPALLAVFQLVTSIGAGRGQPDRRPVDWFAALLLLSAGLSLIWMRKYPVQVLAFTAGAFLLYLLREYPYGSMAFSPLIAAFNAILTGHRAAAWITGALLYAGHLGGRFLLDLDRPQPFEMLAIGVWFAVLLAIAEIVRVRRERMADRMRAHAETERRRAGEERLRIAQELHDVVAHHISLINVQAGVALHLVDSKPEQTATALAAIKDASKEALVELRSLVGILRSDDEEAPRAPVPGLARLDELVSRTRQAGLDVRTTVQGEHRPLPAHVDAAAYRIIQESLTNIVRHAKASRATVRVGYGDSAITLQVDDDGRGGTAPEGNGITGMRERAAALGGTFSAGPTSGGFRVSARLPFADAADDAGDDA
jgi:signal transduction histidine kinase